MDKSQKKETEIEMLARLVVSRFDIMEGKIDGMQKGMGSMQKGMNGLQNQVDELRDEMRTGFSNVHLEQKETNRRLESLERKQIGTLESLYETVLRSEFGELEGRVMILEEKIA